MSHLSLGTGLLLRALLGGALCVLLCLLLGGCKLDRLEQQHQEKRAAQLQKDNAQYYLRLCLEAIERERARPDGSGKLPAALDGQNCHSQWLGDYRLKASDERLVKSSVIRLDPGRLSAYTLTVTGLDGETLEYRDRGVTEAEAEQAGTFGPGDTVAAPAEVQEEVREAVTE